MSKREFKAIRFEGTDDKAFGIDVRKRVDEYFKSNNISRHGDYRSWIKVVLLPLLYLTPFVLLLLNVFGESTLLYFGLWILMGVGLAGIGLGIMHDACHGALSKNLKVNDIVGSVLNIIGGYMLNWKIQHNVLHHTYTNIDDLDEDIDPSGVMRFSPNKPLKPMYKYQVYYAWFFYGLMTLIWATFKDFVQLNRYNKFGLVAAQGKKYKVELARIIAQKIIYYSIFLVLPLIFIEAPVWLIIVGWLTQHFVAGLILALVFQPAHCIPEAEFPVPDENNVVKADWAAHQMRNTANFAPTNWLLSWYVGGLNFQVEHHLFPSMSHVHHKEVAKIVKATALEHGLPYYSEPTFFGAIVNHVKMLKKLSK
jgi:linoleoyl-CoA desaturase